MTNSKHLVIPTIYFGQILSTEVRSYIKLLQNKNKRENIKMWDWGILFVPSFVNCIVVVVRFC